MRDFSIVEAGLVGFRLARERPRAIAVWAVAQLIYGFATIAVLIGSAGQALTELQAAAGNGPQDPAAALAQVAELAPAYAAILVLGLLFATVMTAAASRAVLTPRDDRLGYLRLGGDELRLLVVLLAVGAILFLAYLAGAMVIGLLAAVTGGAGALVVLIPLLLVFLLWLWARFSLAAPLTLSRRTIDVFGSWRLTRGRGTKVFLTYLMAAGLYLLVALLGLAIFAGVGAAISGSAGPMDAVARADMSSFGSYFNPLTVTYMLVTAAFGALGSAIMLCPPAVVYRRLAGEDPAAVF